MVDKKELRMSIDDPQFRITPYQQMFAACSGALITSLFMTPLDVVKIRLQAQQKALVANKCFLYCNGLMDHMCTCIGNGGSTQEYWYKRPSHFNGTLDAIVKISRTEGLSSLWSGLSPTLVLAIPATVVYFVTYEQLRARIADYANASKPAGTPQPLWAPLLSGCTARLWAATTVSPLELIRTKMQSKRLSYFEVHEALRSLLKYHGWTGLWKGLGPTLLRDVPFSGVYWVTYEKLKIINNNNTTFGYSLMAGSIAGSLAACLTNPFDVVKTYRQIEMAEKEIIAGKHRLLTAGIERPLQKKPPTFQNKTTYSVLLSIYNQNGLSGLFTGLIPRIIKVAPACAIMVATFEYGKSFFQTQNLTEYQNQMLIQLNNKRNKLNNDI